MKKLFPVAAVMSASAAIALAAVTMFSSIVEAKPSVEDGLSIYKFCGQMGKDASNMYILKERGFDKQFVIEAVVSEGGSESYAQFLADATYELRTGMAPAYVHVGMSKACVKAMTKEAVK